jgi:WhiB family redox-sensing transcriptional regulator
LGERVEIYDSVPRDGSCANHSVNLWFTPTGKSQVSRKERKLRADNESEAKSICLSCHIKTHCLEYSLRHEPFGTWGGLNEIERAELRQQRKINLSRDGRLTVPGVGTMNAGTGYVTSRKKHS